MVQNRDTRRKLVVLRLRNEKENGGYYTVMRYEIWWIGLTALKRKRINRCNISFGYSK
jgi:hypothetical protein